MPEPHPLSPPAPSGAPRRPSPRVLRTAGLCCAGVVALVGALALAQGQGLTPLDVATDGCPATLAGARPTGEGLREDAAEHLVPVLPVPVGAIGATVCRYEGADGVVAAVRLDASRAMELAGVADDPRAATPTASTGSAVTGTSGWAVTFTYADGDDQVLVVGADGAADNGALEATGRTDLVQALLRLTD